MSLQTAPAREAAGTAPAPDDRPEAPMPPLPRHWRSLPRVFVRRARSLWGEVSMVDSTGASRTYGRVLLEAMALARVLGRELADREYVGLLLPPLVPTAVANIAVALRGKVP